MESMFYCAYGSFIAFGVAYLYANGLQADTIGVILAVSTLAAFIGSFLLGQLCDRLQNHKKVYIGCHIAMFLAACLVYFFVHTPLVGVFYAFLSILGMPVSSNLDTWLLKSIADRPQDYGFIRSFGSLGYALFTLVYGNLIARFGYGIMLFVLAFFNLASIVLAVITPEPPTSTAANAKAARQRGALPALLKNSHFLMLMLILFFMGFIHHPTNNYLAMIFESVGADVSFQGMALAFSAFAQIPMLLLSNRFVKYSSYWMLFIATVLHLITNLMIALGQSAVFVLSSYLVVGLCYGILLPTLRRAVFDLSTPALRTTAQGLADAFFHCLSNMASSLFAGFILVGNSVSLLMLICSGITALILPLILLLIRMDRKAVPPHPDEYEAL